jgi:predicted transposase/invertase (TIGR01784 family)
MDFKDRTDLPEGIIKAIEEFERIKDDPNLQMEAVSKQIAILDYMQVIEDATNKGKAEGEIKGDRNAKYEMVKKMKARGSSLEYIADITGLDLETIEKL